MIYESDEQRDERFMREAMREAMQAAEEGEVPVGAVVVHRGTVIARAHNEVERLRDVTAHAEMLAITAAAEYLGGKYLSECTLYVTVEPCCMCAGAIGWAQIPRILYGAPDPRRGYSSMLPVHGGTPFHPKAVVQGGLLGVECTEIMRQFFRSRR